MKSIIVKLWSKYENNKSIKEHKRAYYHQKTILKKLIKKAENTIFGRSHNFDKINNYQDFTNNVPLYTYEKFEEYILKIKKGIKNVTWKGRPIYFCKTSGTTSGIKYIPITKDSISNHLNSTRKAVFAYTFETGKTSYLNGKWIFLSGSPILDTSGVIPTGRLSGIVNHHVPAFFRTNQMPKYKTNCIDDWETKVNTITDETINKNMTVIGGIPSWVQMYFDKLREKGQNKTITSLFPNLDLLVHGGVNFEPYVSKFEKDLGKKIGYIELFPASEGFFAYQNSQKEKGLLLNVNDGIFYEFVKMEQINEKKPERICLEDVEVGINYALIISSNAGLWAYNIGDTVKFVSKNPYKILVTGRTKHFISAFGEHVISEEVEQALSNVIKILPCTIVDFIVAPVVSSAQNELPYHEWLIEFAEEPEDLKRFAELLNVEMVKKNIYYSDLILGKVLQHLKIRTLPKDSFIKYMKSIGKLGGQNKLPRVTNNRDIADKVIYFAGN